VGALKIVIRMLFIALFCSMSMGCGTGEIAVHGTVTFDGNPIPDGSIIFESEDGKTPSVGGQIMNGKYEFVGPPEGVGKKIVRIRAIRKTGRQIEAGPPAPKGTKVDETEVFIPPIYGEKSTLTAELKSGSNEYDFALKPVKK